MRLSIVKGIYRALSGNKSSGTDKERQGSLTKVKLSGLGKRLLIVIVLLEYKKLVSLRYICEPVYIITFKQTGYLYLYLYLYILSTALVANPPRGHFEGELFS